MKKMLSIVVLIMGLSVNLSAFVKELRISEDDFFSCVEKQTDIYLEKIDLFEYKTMKDLGDELQKNYFKNFVMSKCQNDFNNLLTDFDTFLYSKKVPTKEREEKIQKIIDSYVSVIFYNIGLLKATKTLCKN